MIVTIFIKKTIFFTKSFFVRDLFYYKTEQLLIFKAVCNVSKKVKSSMNNNVEGCIFHFYLLISSTKNLFTITTTELLFVYTSK